MMLSISGTESMMWASLKYMLLIDLSFASLGKFSSSMFRISTLYSDAGTFLTLFMLAFYCSAAFGRSVLLELWRT